MMASSRDCAALSGEIRDIFEQLGGLLGDLTGGRLDEDENLMIDTHLEHWFDAFHALRERHEKSQLAVALLALAKSGKSTFINSLLGQELLPVNNVPETARICKITHAPSSQPSQLLLPTATPAGDASAPAPEPITGTAAVREALQQLNHQVRAREHHAPGDERLLQLSCSFAALEEGGPFQEGADSVAHLALIDTPGPNEAGEEGLRFQVERLLDGVDALIYLLDYTKLKTVEEASVLARLRSINPALVQRLSTRLFFVVNKFDQAEEGQGLGAADTRAYVAELVTRQMDCPGFSLHPEQVLLLSARDALLARLMLSGNADAATQQRFLRLAFGMFSTGRRAPGPQQVSAAAQELLEGSGVPQLEERVLGFLFSHAAVVKLLATVDDLQRLIGQVSNVALSCRAALDRGVGDLQARYAALEGRVTATARELDEVLEATGALEGEVTDELRGHLGNLRLRLYQYICATLDNYHATAASSAATAALASTPVGASSTPGRWAAVRQRFVALLSRGGGGRDAVYGSKDELAGELMDLQDDLMQQIRAEVEEAWCRMEVATNGRAAALVDTLNTALDRLSEQVEGAVAEQLEVRLTPVSLHLVPPSAEEFHTDLEELISKGVGEVHQHQLRTNERVVLEWQRQRGICRLRDRWVQVPRRRRMVEIYTQVTYQVTPDTLRDHFMALVDASITTTEAQLGAYVAAYVRRHVEAARRAIQGYSQRYLQAMNAAISMAARTQEQRAAAVQQLDSYAASLSRLAGRAGSLQQRAEAMVPHNSGAAGVWEQMGYPSDEEEGVELAEAVAGAASAPAAPAAADLLGEEVALEAPLLAETLPRSAAVPVPAPPAACLEEPEGGAAALRVASAASSSSSVASSHLSSLSSLEAMFEEAMASVAEGRLLAMQALPHPPAAAGAAVAAAAAAGAVTAVASATAGDQQQEAAEEELHEGEVAQEADMGDTSDTMVSAIQAAEAFGAAMVASAAGGELVEDPQPTAEGDAAAAGESPSAGAGSEVVGMASSTTTAPDAEAEQEEAEDEAAAMEHPYELLLDDILGARPLQVAPPVTAVVRGDVVPAFGAAPSAASTSTSIAQVAGEEEGAVCAADVAGAMLLPLLEEGEGTAADKPAAGSMGLPRLDVLDRGFLPGDAAADGADAGVTSPVCSDGMGDASYTVVTTGDLQTTPSSGGMQEGMADSLLGGLGSPSSQGEQVVEGAAAGEGEGCLSAGASQVVQAAGDEEVGQVMPPAAEQVGSSLADSISSGRSVGGSKPAAVAQELERDAAVVPDQGSSQPPAATAAAAAAGSLGSSEEGVGSTPYASIHGSMYASIVAESDDMDASPNAAFLRSFNAALRAYGADPDAQQQQGGAAGGATGGSSSEGGGNDEWTLVAEGEGAQEEEVVVGGQQEVQGAAAPAAPAATGSGLFGRRR